MNEKPLILHLCPTAGPLGGIWTYIRHIQESRLADTYRFDVCFYPGPSVGVSPRVIGALRREVQRRAPDLLHLHGLQTEGFNCMMGARLGSRSPRLLTVHGFIEDSKFRTPWRRAFIARVLEPLTLLGADAAFAVSRYGAEKPAMRRWTRRLLGCIDNALPRPVAPDARAVAAVRQRLGWTGQDVVAVCVARLSREKGLLDLVEAFERVADQQPALRLLLVGDGPDAEAIRKRLAARTAGQRVVIHPATTEVTVLLAAADIFVLPSLHENQSFAILEAMAAGLPVLSTQVGGTPELVRHGVTGLLVPPAQPIALADALGQLTADAALRHRLGCASREAVEREHDFDKFLGRLDSAYRDVLGARAANDAPRPGAASPAPTE
jgi:glycosyltransferase involved in cell wall biosynthesis